MTQLPWNNIIGRFTCTYDQTQGDFATNTFYVAAVNDALAVSVMDVDDLVVCATVIRDSIESMINGALSFYTGFKLNRVDAYTLAATGTHAAITKRTVVGTNKPGSGTSAVPPEVAVVASLYGYDPAGFEPERARRRGRIYMGGLSINALAGNGLVNAGFPPYLSAAIAGMADDLWDADLSSDLHGDLVVASRTANYLSEVSHVRVDNIPDVQRRRQNAITPTYTTETVAHT